MRLIGDEISVARHVQYWRQQFSITNEPDVLPKQRFPTREAVSPPSEIAGTAQTPDQQEGPLQELDILKGSSNFLFEKF